MKTILRTLLLLGIVFVSPFIFLFTAMRLAGYSATSMQQTFADSGMYETAVKELHTYLQTAREENDPEDPLLLIAPFLEKEITPSYLRQKTDALISDTARWASGTTSTAPVVSFADLKEKLMKQHAYLAGQLKTMSDEFAAQKKEMETAAQENPQEFGNAEAPDMPDFNINTILQTDFAIPVGRYLWLLPLWHKAASLGLLILSGFSLISLVAIVLLGDTPSAKLRWSAATFAVVGLWNLIPWAVMTAGPMIISGAVIRSTHNLPAFVLPVAGSLTQKLVGAYTHVTGIALIICFVFCVLCFGLSFFPSATATASTRGKKTRAN